MIRRLGYRIFLGAGLAVSLAAGPSFAALADEGDTPQKLERLQDNRMEYDELFDLVKNYYGPISSGYATIEAIRSDNANSAVESQISASDLVAQANELVDEAKGGTAQEQAAAKAQASALRASAKSLRSQAFMTNQGLSSYDSQIRSLDRSTNGVVQGVESMMNQYEQLLSQRQAAAKGVETAQKAAQVQQAMESQGMAVSADVLAAAAQLSGAQDQLSALDGAISQLHMTLCQFTGWGADGNPEIGPVPAADAAAVASIDVESDKEKAVNNNYNVISMRSSTGGGMTMVQQHTTKTTTQKKNKIRNVEYTEDTVRSNIQTLYDTILEKKALYDSAATAWQGAQNTWNSVQVERQRGMLSDVQYLQQETAYLQAKSAMECADLELQQAMRNYEWAVKGVEVSAE